MIHITSSLFIDPQNLLSMDNVIFQLSFIELSLFGFILTVFGNKNDKEPTELEKYRSIINHMNDAVYLFKVHEDGTPGNIEEVNQVTVERTGYSAEELMELTVLDIAADDLKDKVRNQINQILHEEQITFEWVHKEKNGATIPVEINAKVVYFNSKPHVVAVARDISERKEMERRLQHDMQRRQKMEALGQIAGGIAHDFNNVLAAINGAAQMLDVISDDPKIEKYIDMISSSVKRGTGITGRILTFTREKELTLEPVILQEFIEEIIHIARHTFPKTINISYHRKPEPILIKSDPTQLQQAILTILINAADAMKHKGIIKIDTLYPSEKNIKNYDRKKYHQTICVAISDTGVGMDRETKRRIFEPFFTTKGDAKGTGIGLAVTKKIIELHNGWIEVDSQEGTGTTFTIAIPLAENQKAVFTDKSIDNLQTEDHQSVLIIEDEKEIQALLATALTKLGYTIYSADNANEALDKFQIYQEDLDIIVTDIGLPDINGSLLIEQIRDASSDIPVIATTGYINQDLRKHLLDIGVAQILYKPYELSDVAAAIQATLYHT